MDGRRRSGAIQTNLFLYGSELAQIVMRDHNGAG
jgi:hypothetical protein